MTRHMSVKNESHASKTVTSLEKYIRNKNVFRSYLKVDKNAVLKSSVKLSGSEFQTVGAAWQKARLPNTVLAPAT